MYILMHTHAQLPPRIHTCTFSYTCIYSCTSSTSTALPCIYTCTDMYTSFWISGGLYDNSLFVCVTTTSLRWKARDNFKLLHCTWGLPSEWWICSDVSPCPVCGVLMFSPFLFPGTPGFKGSDGYLGEEGIAVSHDLLQLTYSYKPKKGNKDQSEGSDAASRSFPSLLCLGDKSPCRLWPYLLALTYPPTLHSELGVKGNVFTIGTASLPYAQAIL